MKSSENAGGGEIDWDKLDRFRQKFSSFRLPNSGIFEYFKFRYRCNRLIAVGGELTKNGIAAATEIDRRTKCEFESW